MNDAYDDASTLLDNDDVPLGEFLDCNIPIFNLDVIHRSSYAYHILFAFLVVILEILSNSRTQGESWGFHKFSYLIFSQI